MFHRHSSIYTGIVSTVDIITNGLNVFILCVLLCTKLSKLLSGSRGIEFSNRKEQNRTAYGSCLVFCSFDCMSNKIFCVTF
jgi:uncharacterized UPF0160 family protein